MLVSLPQPHQTQYNVNVKSHVQNKTRKIDTNYGSSIKKTSAYLVKSPHQTLDDKFPYWEGTAASMVYTTDEDLAKIEM